MVYAQARDSLGAVSDYSVFDVISVTALPALSFNVSSVLSGLISQGASVQDLVNSASALASSLTVAVATTSLTSEGQAWLQSAQVTLLDVVISTSATLQASNVSTPRVVAQQVSSFFSPLSSSVQNFI